MQDWINWAVGGNYRKIEELCTGKLKNVLQKKLKELNSFSIKQAQLIASCRSHYQIPWIATS